MSLSSEALEISLVALIADGYRVSFEFISIAGNSEGSSYLVVVSDEDGAVVSEGESEVLAEAIAMAYSQTPERDEVYLRKGNRHRK